MIVFFNGDGLLISSHYLFIYRPCGATSVYHKTISPVSIFIQQTILYVIFEFA